MLLVLVFSSLQCGGSFGWISEASAQSVVVPSVSCGSGAKMKVHFYNVGEGLAVLIALPDRRHILVDTGDFPRRQGCGSVCSEAHSHLIDQLERDLKGAPIDMLWITHLHSDHIGGASLVLRTFKVNAYVDNGQGKKQNTVRRIRTMARRRRVRVVTVDPGHRDLPIESSSALQIRAIVPPRWPKPCHINPNNCSIGLRVDYCNSSVLFIGDAEAEEEKLLDLLGSITLFQVGHHGSDTSSSESFLSKLMPKYAVISAGRAEEGLNRHYCHPHTSAVVRVNAALGGSFSVPMRVFDNRMRCNQAREEDWKSVLTSDRLWITSRDGDIVLTTTGDGVFQRE
ncbi:hypothetical protein BCY86_04005 [Pajaroellobacter abortibovis]|uniref:Metallo-beta-lactamase domain-containing protein n=1 Tax=Pajaroellobacter abortibovis TaxID=1882918 RepID=A0A1L6MWM3_9BACT|nr:hypothetical protein BCY86_04005 [Pajaroellobacter abortibovis]